MARSATASTPRRSGSRYAIAASASVPPGPPTWSSRCSKDSAFAIIGGTPRVYDHRSSGSGKRVGVNFCPTCGTKLFLAFERFPNAIGVYGGTFDDPNWFDRASENARHIFVDSAQRGTVIPAEVAVFREHAIDGDGNPVAPRVFAALHVVGSDGNWAATKAKS